MLPDYIWNAFASHYDDRLGGAGTAPVMLSEVKQAVPTQLPGYYYQHPKLREGNGPRILYHGDTTQDVIVLTHGFTDSPFYMQDVATRFFEVGCNVILPLLPAHGLKEPDEAIRQEELDNRWRNTVDASVAVARLLGQRVSIGGFSTGGVLSLNKILRHSEMIDGGLFLFSAALSLGRLADKVGNSEIAEWVVGFFLDRTAVIGKGPDPYKYPILPASVASEVVEIIQEGNAILQNIETLPHPVFAAHSQHDETAEIQGVIDFLSQHVSPEKQLFFSIADKKVMHATLPLKTAVPIDLTLVAPNEKSPKQRKIKQDDWLKHVAANPHFEEMMNKAINFFQQKVQGGYA